MEDMEDSCEAPAADPPAWRASVERMVAAASMGNVTATMMVQEIDTHRRGGGGEMRINSFDDALKSARYRLWKNSMLRCVDMSSPFLLKLGASRATVT